MAYPYGGSNSQQVPYVPPQAQSVSVVGPQFCCPHPVDLSVVRKVLTISDGNFVVQDVNGKLLLKVKGALLSLHDRRVLLDAAGAPLLTLRRKIITAHERWEAFRGETKELLFTAKRSSIVHLKTKLDVSLPHNSTSCDFRVDGSWLERSCVIYAAQSNTIVAQMHKRHTVQSVLLGKDNFMVTVYPNVDYAFIVAIIVILDEINKDGDQD